MSGNTTSSRTLLITAAVLSITLLSGVVADTDRPIVGVLAQEVPKEVRHLRPNVTSYIPAAYVKAVEASGARVVPVFINRTTLYYKEIMSRINGMLFPGGSVDFTVPDGFAAAGRIIVDEAAKLQDSGVSFPILGVCQGYELFMYLEAHTSCYQDIFTHCDSKNIALPLEFRPGFQESRLYKHASEEVLDILKNLPVTSNHHVLCVTEDKLKERGLEKTWRILSTNKDKQGLEFISSSEHFHRPIAGVQFHPEKNLFEWNPSQANPHFRKAIFSARYFYDWLVAKSRENSQAFPSAKEEEDHLMYKYSPEYTGLGGGYDEQTYFF